MKADTPPPPPFSEEFQEGYWSLSGGVEEKTHVFLNGNRLPERFISINNNFTIAELGFGTGLSFLLASALWHRTAPADTTLTFVSYEKYPLELQKLINIYSSLPDFLQEPAQRLLAAYAPRPGWNTWCLPAVTLHLYVGDVAAGLATQPFPADAWFLDGFSPAVNPEMWAPEVLAAVVRHTNPGGTLATYTVAQMVREGLTQAGFVVAKSPGHPPKKHMLTAHLPV